MSFSRQLKRRREALGLSRAALADRLGVTVSAISNYENGVSSPKEDVLLRLFDVLNVDPNYLYAGCYRAAEFMPNADERQLLEQLRTLSPLGRQTVRTLVEALTDYRDDCRSDSVEAEPRMIPLYAYPAAAGYASPVCGQDFTYIPVDETVPRGAEFAVRIQGDSMEPQIADGSVVYVNHEALADGDVGIFCVDGMILCKQYHHDDAYGMTYLFSLNRRREDADVLLPPSSGSSLVCFGRVMLAHRPELP